MQILNTDYDAGLTLIGPPLNIFLISPHFYHNIQVYYMARNLIPLHKTSGN